MIPVKYKVYLDELDEKCNELTNYIKNDINDKINELSHAFDDVNRFGNASTTYINGYNRKIEKLIKLEHNMELLANYLKEYHDNYSETNNSLGKSWTSFIDEMRGDNNGL